MSQGPAARREGMEPHFSRRSRRLNEPVICSTSSGSGAARLKSVPTNTRGASSVTTRQLSTGPPGHWLSQAWLRTNAALGEASGAEHPACHRLAFFFSFWPQLCHKFFFRDFRTALVVSVRSCPHSLVVLASGASCLLGFPPFLGRTLPIRCSDDIYFLWYVSYVTNK